MEAETARIAEEQRIINKRNSLNQRMPVPEGSVSSRSKNKAPSLANRWTPNTKIAADEIQEPGKADDRPSYKTKSTLLDKFSPRPIY